MAKVKLEQVTKRFGDFTAVHEFSLDIRDGEFVVLVGPSGCGKTTILRMIAGLEDVSEGAIYIDGEMVNDVHPKDRDVAMVFQNYALYPHMNVFDNMAFSLKLRRFIVSGPDGRPVSRRLPRDEVDQRVKQAAELLGIADQLEKKPVQLSGGQRQRVAVGRSIVRDPKVFLFDEPLSNLDAKLRVAMRAELSKLHGRLGSTMIYVTHDQAEAMTLGDRVVVLKDGRVQQVAEPQYLYDYPANLFVAGFIGSPAMNFLPVDVQAQDGSLSLRAPGFALSVPDDTASKARSYLGREIVMGIRPEDIYHAEEGWTPEKPARVRGRVEVAENMGSDVFLHVAAGDSRFLARVGGGTTARVGDEVDVIFDMERIHLFDPTTQGAIA